MVKAKKTFGENPEKVTVLAEQVEFDKDGFADVSEEVAEVLMKIPGYEVGTNSEKEGYEEAEKEAEEKPAPKKPAPRKPAPKKA